MKFENILGRSSRLISDNSPVILTTLAVAGVVTTAYLTHKAAVQSTLIVEEMDPHATKREIFDETWKLYIPPVSAAAVTCTSIIMANRIGARRAAAVAAAYTLSERAFDEYRSKVVEQIGEKKEQKVRDEVAREIMERTPLDKAVIISTGSGDVLCLDAYSGRYFNSNMEALRKAQNDINARVLSNAEYATLSDYYHEIGLSDTTGSKEFGWNRHALLELEFSAMMTEDESKPCMVVTFSKVPRYKPWGSY